MDAHYTTGLEEEGEDSEGPRNADVLELQIESDRILKIMESMVSNMEVAACLPLLLQRQDILKEHLTNDELDEVNGACAKYIGKSYPSRKTVGGKKTSVPLSQMHRIDPKVDPRLASALNIIIECESITPFVKALLPDISDAARAFLDHLIQLYQIAKDRLAVSAQEEAERERKVRLAYRNNERTKLSIYEVTRKLQEQRDRLHTSLTHKEEVVNQHKETINLITKKCQQDTWRRVQESERDMMLDSKASEERQEILLEEARIAQAQYDKLVAQHLATEKDLRVKKTKVESQLISWLNKYDSDIGERQRELDEINAEYDADKEEYDKLQELFEKQETEYNTLMEEKEEEERKEMEAKLYAFLCHRAQRRIQHAWRAYKQRKIDRKKERALRIQKLKEAKALAKLEKQQKAAEKKKDKTGKTTEKKRETGKGKQKKGKKKVIEYEEETEGETDKEEKPEEEEKEQVEEEEKDKEKEKDNEKEKEISTATPVEETGSPEPKEAKAEDLMNEYALTDQAEDQQIETASLTKEAKGETEESPEVDQPQPTEE